MKKYILLFIALLTVYSFAQENRIIRQDSLRASEQRLKSAIHDSLTDNSQGFLQGSDTTSLSNRINLKLTATDTASLSSRINALPTFAEASALINDSLVANSQGFLQSADIANKLDATALTDSFNTRGFQNANQVKTLIGDTVRNFFRQYSSYSITVLDPIAVQDYVLEYVTASYSIDSIFAVVGDSSVSYKLYYSTEVNGSPVDLIDVQIISNNTTGIWTSFLNATVPNNRMLHLHIISADGLIGESLIIKIFFTLR